MSSQRVDIVTQLLQNKNYDVISEYASIDHADKGKLIVSEYCGRSVRAYKDAEGNTRVMCPKNMDTIQEGHVANAIANGTIFDDADEVSRNAEMIEGTALPINGIINRGMDMPKHIRPMIAIVIGRMGEDGKFDTEGGRTNGINFVKDLCCKDKDINDVCDNYLEKEPDEYYGHELGHEIHAMKPEVENIRDVDYEDSISDDDMVDSYDGYDMEELESDPEDRDKDDDGVEENDEDKDEESSDDESDDDEDNDAENFEGEDAEEEEMTQEAGNPYINTKSVSILYKRWSTKNGEQYKPIAKFWDIVEKHVKASKLQGYGTDWTGYGTDFLYGIIFKNGNIPKEVIDDVKKAFPDMKVDNSFSIPSSFEETYSGDTENIDSLYDKIWSKGFLSHELEEFTDDGKCTIRVSYKNKAVQESYIYDDDEEEMTQEGFLSKKPKKLKPIPRDVVAYITVEMNAIHSSNDQAMLAGYTCSKIELVDFYLTCIDTQDARYIVPHNKQYLEQMKKDLENLLAQILRIRPINRTEQIWRVNYPTT